MSYGILVAIIAFGIAMLTAGLQAALYRVGGLYRNGLLEEDQLNSFLLSTTENPRHFILATGIIHLMAMSLLSVALVMLGVRFWPELLIWQLLVFVVLVISVIGSVGSVLVKMLASRSAVAYANISVRFLFPFMMILKPWTTLLLKITGPDEEDLWAVDAMAHLSSGEIRSLLGEQDSGVDLEDEEKEMIQSIFSFHETTVKEIMIPRIDVIALNSELPAAEAIKTVVSCRHSRVPVFERSIDKVVGLLYSKDLLALVENNKLSVDDTTISGLVRPACFIPESKKLDEVLEEFRSSRIHMAVVVDEYGGTAGLVTLEDVLEEIVGEIEDEFDEQETLYEWLDEYSMRVDPKIDLEDLRDLLGVNLPVDGSETLAGLVYEAGGKVPEAKDQVTIAELEVLVEKVEDQRILQVKLTASNPLPGFSQHQQEDDNG
jgi:CBS domain containing-hemolysin-like protein